MSSFVRSVIRKCRLWYHDFVIVLICKRFALCSAFFVLVLSCTSWKYHSVEHRGCRLYLHWNDESTILPVSGNTKAVLYMIWQLFAKKKTNICPHFLLSPLILLLGLWWQHNSHNLCGSIDAATPSLSTAARHVIKWVVVQNFISSTFCACCCWAFFFRKHISACSIRKAVRSV